MSVIAKAPATRSAAGSGLLSLMPGVFVVLWSTGFIGAKYGLPYAEPLTFLALRFSLVAAIMLVASLALGAAWPVGWRNVGHIALVGIFIQATYLGGVFYGIAHGVSAGIAGLIAGLQPLITAALVGIVLGEVVTPRQWLGIALGLVGLVLVLWGRIALDLHHFAALAAVVAAPFGMTSGTLYQKRFCAAVDLRSATVIQNATAGLLMLVLALASESMHIEWRAEFVLALFWLCLVLSVGATMLLLFLLRRGAASRIGSLFYLVPPVTAFMAYLLFGETLGVTALVGMAVTALAVGLVNRD
ncbi:MAG TPA: DMT family transporter [Stellaceae bacterium]|nr:DMT family transporter [Stellaceae bacterium]